MLSIALTIACVLLAVALAGCYSLWRQRGVLIDEQGRLKQERDAAAESARRLDRDLAVVRESQQQAERQFKELRDQSQQTFKSLAGDVLKDSGEQLLKLAAERFRAEQAQADEKLEARRKAVEELVKPVRETLEKYNTSIQDVEKARKEAYGSMSKQLEMLAFDQDRLRQETANLSRALRRPEVRGRWGEMQLRRVVELAGMIDNCDFNEQPSIGGDNGEGGIQRPDMLVNLPSNRTIVVDAKTPLDAYLDAIECDGDDERRECLTRHAGHVEAKVRELAKKQYVKHLDRSPDFVVLFIPGESFLQAAVQLRPNLMEQAMERGVVIATPTTLISLLRAVAVGWREEQIAENARKIGEVATELYERVATTLGHLETHGKHLRKAVESYGKIKGSFESRVVVTGRKLKRLGLESDKQLKEHLPGTDDLPALPSEEIAPAEQGSDRD